MRRLFIVLMLLGTPVVALAGEAEFTGKAGNFVAYFTKDHKIRHERWEFSAKQTASFGMKLKTVIEGRLWWDMALMDNEYAARHEYSQAVRDDELFDGEARNLYADYLGDLFRLKAGRQIVDWTGAPSPALLDLLTPMDIRHGVTYSATELIVPVNALSLTHSFFFDGTLEWLLIPEGAHHRLAKGDNGYGYYQALRDQIAPRSLILVDEEIPKKQDETEFGLRYQITLASVDFTLLGFHGHQRSPSYVFDPSDKAVTVTQFYPRVNTFGTIMAYAQDAWVGRFLAFYEPKRKLRVIDSRADFDGDEVYDRRFIFGLGFDWVFSRHLKFYSEHYGHRQETVVPPDPTPAEDKIAGVEDGYEGMARITNETFDNVLFSVEAIVSAPDRSRIITPSVELDFWDSYKLTFGARLYSSEHPDSRFALLKDSSHYFARLETKVNIAQMFAD